MTTDYPCGPEHPDQPEISTERVTDLLPLRAGFARRMATTFMLELRTERIGKLEEFAKSNGMHLLRFTNGERSLVLVSREADVQLSEEWLKKAFDALRKSEAMGIGNNCYFVAEDLMDAGIASDRLHAAKGAGEFIGFPNHYVALCSLPDGSSMALDSTVGRTIDWDQGTFEILALHGKDEPEVIELLNGLYGGDWEHSNQK